jgi:hypothetical protein
MEGPGGNDDRVGDQGIAGAANLVAGPPSAPHSVLLPVGARATAQLRRDGLRKSSASLYPFPVGESVTAGRVRGAAASAPSSSAEPEPIQGTASDPLFVSPDLGCQCHAIARNIGGRREKSASWLVRATWAFVGLGLLIRLVRYFVVYPIWHDEAFLAVNFLDRGYRDLLRPLDYAQVSPILFLWVELTVVRLLGFSEWSLRLFPAVCGIASVILFRHVAARILRGVPLLLAVGIFATAFYPVRHSAEVKPYASDLLASLLLLALAVEWWRAPTRSREWWALAALVPILLAISYPAVFVAAGVSVALAPSVFRLGLMRVRLAFLVYNVALVASFLSIYFGATVFQSSALRDGYRWGYWHQAFPPWSEPWKLMFWLLDVHAGNALAYPLGGEHGGSAATLLAVVVGVLAMWRRGRCTLLALLLSPSLMGLAAAGLGQYPYGGAPRLTQYLAPPFCLLAGLGASVIVARLSPGVRRRRALGVSIVLLAAIGVFLVVRDLCEPYRVRADLETRQFAKAFWQTDGRVADLVCVKSDLGLNFQPHLWSRGMSAVYLFHRGMFARPRVRTDAIHAGIADGSRRTARLVFFDELPDDNPSFNRWLARIASAYEITLPRDYTVNPGKPGELWLRDRYIVLDLVPRGTADERRMCDLNHSDIVR